MEYKTIVCPVGDDELSGLAVETASYVSEISGAKLILLHVVDKWYRTKGFSTTSEEWTRLHEEWLNEGEEFLRKEASRLKEKGVHNIETEMREGEIAYEVVASALENRADLLVLASHRYTPKGKLFWGSVIDRITKNTPCPVLWVFKSE